MTPPGSIDEETERILAEQADRARRTLEQHRAALDAVASALLEHETLTGEAVATLVGAAEHGHRTRARDVVPYPSATSPLTM